jgi:hypothetical protein
MFQLVLHFQERLQQEVTARLCFVPLPYDAGEKERSALAEPKFFEEAFRVSAEELIEGIVKVLRRTPVARFLNSPDRHYFTTIGSTQRKKDYRLLRSNTAEFPLWNLLTRAINA